VSIEIKRFLSLRTSAKQGLDDTYADSGLRAAESIDEADWSASDDFTSSIDLFLRMHDLGISAWHRASASSS
jgi:hypothetical protein